MYFRSIMEQPSAKVSPKFYEQCLTNFTSTKPEPSPRKPLLQTAQKEVTNWKNTPRNTVGCLGSEFHNANWPLLFLPILHCSPPHSVLPNG